MVSTHDDLHSCLCLDYGMYSGGSLGCLVRGSGRERLANAQHCFFCGVVLCFRGERPTYKSSW